MISAETRILAHETLFCRGVDQERFIQAGQDAAIRLDPCELGEGDAIVADLLHQVVDGAGLEAPGVLAEALFGNDVGVLSDVGGDIPI
jgi:hypothetical protein